MDQVSRVNGGWAIRQASVDPTGLIRRSSLKGEFMTEAIVGTAFRIISVACFILGFAEKLGSLPFFGWMILSFLSFITAILYSIYYRGRVTK